MAITGPGQGVRPAIGDVLTVDNLNSMGNQLGVFTRKFKVVAITGQGLTLGEIAVGFEGTYAPLTTALMSAAALHRGHRTAIIWPPVHITASAYSNDNGGAGLVAGDTMAKQVSGLVSHYDGLGGPRHRGRCFIPFPSETDNDPNGLPIAGYVTRLAALSADWNTVKVYGAAGNTISLQPVLFHKADQTTTNIILNTSRGRWATQRRRGDYGRTNAFPVMAVMGEPEQVLRTWEDVSNQMARGEGEAE